VDFETEATLKDVNIDYKNKKNCLMSDHSRKNYLDAKIGK